MLIHYRSDSQRQLLQDIHKLTKKHGKKCAELVIQRIGELEAAEKLADLPHKARAHPLSNNRKGQFALDLEHPKRLIVEPYPEGECDKILIKEVKTIEITDYH